MPEITPEELIARCTQSAHASRAGLGEGAHPETIKRMSATWVNAIRRDLDTAQAGGDVKALIAANNALPIWIRTAAVEILRRNTLTTEEKPAEKTKFEVEASYIGRVYRTAIVEAESEEEAKEIMLEDPASAGDTVAEFTNDLGSTGEQVFDDEPVLESCVAAELPGLRAKAFERNLTTAYAAVAKNIIASAETAEADDDGRVVSTPIDEHQEGALANLAQMLSDKNHRHAHEAVHALAVALRDSEKLSKVEKLLPRAKTAVAVITGDEPAQSLGVKI